MVSATYSALHLKKSMQTTLLQSQGPPLLYVMFDKEIFCVLKACRDLLCPLGWPKKNITMNSGISLITSIILW